MLECSELSGLEKAKKALRQMIQQKVSWLHDSPNLFTSAQSCWVSLSCVQLLFSKQDEMGILLVGSKETANELNDEQGGYEHISVKNPIEVSHSVVSECSS